MTLEFTRPRGIPEGTTLHMTIVHESRKVMFRVIGESLSDKDVDNMMEDIMDNSDPSSSSLIGEAGRKGFRISQMSSDIDGNSIIVAEYDGLPYEVIVISSNCESGFAKRMARAFDKPYIMVGVYDTVIVIQRQLEAGEYVVIEGETDEYIGDLESLLSDVDLGE